MIELSSIPLIPSPKRGRGRFAAGAIWSPDVIVLHYTAGRNDARTVARMFATHSRSASAHYVVGRDGAIVQCVDLDDTSWHAGDGRLPHAERLAKQDRIPVKLMHDRAGVLNARSIGIEICNRGWAPRGRNPYGTAKHRNPDVRSTLWESYTDAQVEAVRELVGGLVEALPTLKYITAHEDVTHDDVLGKTGGKTDIGPMWPWSVLDDCGLARVRYDFAAHEWEVLR